MKSYDRVYANVNLDAIRANVEAFRKHVRKDAMLCAVVKTDGYGLGAVPAAQIVSDFVWGYATATVDEAFNLRKHGINKPILVLGYVPETCYEELIQKEIRFTAFERETVRQLSEKAQQLKKKAFVHIKLDTGMGRIGIPPKEAAEFAKFAVMLPGIVIEGMFSHLATADERDKKAAWEQADVFRKAIEAVEATGIFIPVCHIGNSAAAMEMTEVPGNMFRLGIAMYGYYPSDEVTKGSVVLTPSMELKTVISYVKTVPAGTPIGYGASFVTDRETVVATVPIGYGDGYPRSLSNKGSMLIHGKRVPIIGRVCMDQTMLDVTEAGKVLVGDTVTVIGKDKEEEISVEEAASLAGTFNYEFLCNIGKRIPRIYYRNGMVVGTKDYFQDLYDGDYLL